MVDVRALMMAAAGVATSLLADTFKNLIVDEFKAWTPRVSDRLMHSAVRRLAPEQRDRYAEEWKAALADIPGWIGKLLFALDLHRASFGMRRLLRNSVPVEGKTPRFVLATKGALNHLWYETRYFFKVVKASHIHK